MTEAEGEKSFKSVIIDALNLHNRTVRNYINQVADWKDRFEIIQKQKHKYQEECKNVKKEIESSSQENNKLKGEIDSLRQIVNREHRAEKCAACVSFQHTIQTLKDLYENTINQKDSHISYLENRIRELENVQKAKSVERETVACLQRKRLTLSPDSTCKYMPNKSQDSVTNRNKSLQFEKSQGHEDSLTLDSEKTDKGPKLRLPRNKKRSRYSEDPSPEQKKQRLEVKKSTEVQVDDLQQDTNNKKYSKNIHHEEEETHYVVPETCISDIDLIDEEDETCIGNDEKTANTCNSNENGNQRTIQNHGNKKKWKIAMDTSSSSDNEDGDSSKVIAGRGQKKDINSSWLHNVLKSPVDNNEVHQGDMTRMRMRKDRANKLDESAKRAAYPSMLRKHKSDPQNLNKNATLSSSDAEIVTQSQFDIPIQVVPLRNQKIPSSNDSSITSTIKSNKVTEKINSDKKSSSIHSTPEQKSLHLTGNSQHAIEVPSDTESPLILRTSGITNEVKQKYPEVDILFEESDESPSGKTNEMSRLDQGEEIMRKVKNKKSRSQERSPELLSLSKNKRSPEEKSPEFLASPILRDRNGRKFKSRILLAQNDNPQDTENKLRQTTLSQAFMNNAKQDSDLQLAIERSYVESKHNNQDNEDTIESKENSPPFKKPAIPKNRIKKHKHMKHSDLDEIVSPTNKSKHLPDLDLDDTIAPPRVDVGRGNNCDNYRINGSLDPAIQLSQICEDSQNVGEDTDTMKNNVKNNGLNGSMLKNDFENTLIEFRLEDLQGNSGSPKTSTCVEFDDDSQAIPSSSTSVKFGSGKSRRPRRKLKTGDTQDIDKQENNNKQVMDDSFDVRPKKAEPEYAYVNVVRGRDERRKLKAFWCQECEDYYKDTGMTDEDMQKRMQSCSRHRAEYVPPDTPEHFWSIGFMDTPDCEERGYIHVENPKEEKEPRLRRRKGYKQLFKSRKEDGDDNR